MGVLVIAVNALAIFIAGGMGDVLRSKVSLRDRRIILQICGAVVLLLGAGGLFAFMVDTATKQAEPEGSFLPVVMLLIGWGVGHVLRIQQGLLKLGRVFVCFFDRDKKEKRVDPSLTTDDFEGLLADGEDQFGYGFMLATVLVSSGVFFMNVAAGNTDMGFAKVAIDALVVFALGVVYGGGASMSALSVIVLQGVLGLIFSLCSAEIITTKFIGQMTVMSGLIMTLAGGVMVTGKRMKVADLLPGYALALVYQLAVVPAMP